MSDRPKSVSDWSFGSPRDKAEAALAAIEQLEPTVGAFVAHDADEVRAQARTAAGPLAGLTVGIKDIIDSSHYCTEYGSPIYAGHRPRGDAACVALLEAAGAISVGKTVTTEFAFFRPGKTRNPHDLSRTPGGSSSGSAAAVACGMVDLGLGSQTAASLTRPASYCGVVGFKPSYEHYNLSGVKGLAPSFDTLGLLSARVATVAAAHAVLRGPTASPFTLTPRPPRRIGFCRTPWWDRGDAGMHQALETAAGLLGRSVPVEPVDLGVFADTADLHATIMGYEAAQALAWEYHRRRELLSPQILKLIEAGRATDAARYRAAMVAAEDARRRINDRLFDGCDLVLAPASPGEAPQGLESTGDPIFSRMWTLLRLPTITLPGLTGPAGVPIGIQLLAPLGADDRLLDHAAWAETMLPERPLPVRVGGGDNGERGDRR